MAAGEVDTFTRIYRGLREELADARLAPAAQIRVDRTAERFGTSATPVREALARLAGERLVVGDRRRGYFVPCLSTDAIRDLLTLSELLVVAAVRARKSARHPSVLAPDATGADMMLAILERADAPIFLDAGRLVIERLAQLRSIEAEVLDLSAERADLAALDQHAPPGAQAAHVRRYHARRRRVAAELARAIARRSDQPHEYIPDMV